MKPRTLTDKELLDNVAQYIREFVGKTDQKEHAFNISSYLAAGIGWKEDMVIDYLSAKLEEKENNAAHR